METGEGKQILSDIINKGGLLGSSASFYLNDCESTNKFIIECYEQCHNEFMIEYMGAELVSRITKYCENLPHYTKPNFLLNK